MSATKLRAVIKATEQFINSKTSTKKGIEHVRNTTIQSISTTLGLNGKFGNLEAEALYDMLTDENVQEIIKKIPPSEFWAIVEDSKEHFDTEEQFLERMLDYIDFTHDNDTRARLQAIYNKYIIDGSEYYVYDEDIENSIDNAKNVEEKKFSFEEMFKQVGTELSITTLHELHKSELVWMLLCEGKTKEEIEKINKRYKLDLTIDDNWYI